MNELAEHITRAMEHDHIPGVAAGIIWDGRDEAAGFGVTSVDTRVPVDAATIFQCGSISKTFTAMAIMRMVEAGSLDLDRPIRVYLPDLALADEAVAAAVTLRHLLTHTAGWYGDYFADKGRGEDALARYVADLHLLPQIAPLGALFSYSNAGFSLAGRVIEVVAAKPYETVIEELIFEPLGMDQTFFSATDVITRRFAVGHSVEGQEARVVHRRSQPFGWELPGGAHPAGGVAPTMRDLLRYARFHLGDGTTMAADGQRVRLLTRDSMRLMQSPLVAKGPTVGDGAAVGLAWHLETRGGMRVVTHTGGTNGQLSLLTLVPQQGFALALLTNAGTGGKLIEQVSDWALEHYLGLPPRRYTPRAPAAHDLQPYVGRYCAPGFAGVAIILGEAGLLRQALGGDGKPTSAPAVPVQFYADDVTTDGDGPFAGRPMAEFLRRPDGSIGWIRVGGRAYARQ